MAGRGSGTEKRTASDVADFDVLRLDFKEDLFSTACESDLTDELLDCGADEEGVSGEEQPD